MRAIFFSLAYLFAAFAPAALGASVRQRPVTHPLPCSSGVVAINSQVIDIAVDRGFVYYGDYAGNLYRVSRHGGTPTLLAAMAGRWTMFLAVDDERVYFVSREIPSNRESIYAIAKSGGSPSLITDSGGGFEVVVDEDWVYAIAPGTPQPNATWLRDGSIRRFRKDGTATETIASSLKAPMGMVIDGETIYFTEYGLSINDASGGLRSVPKTGGAVSNLASFPHAIGIAQSATTLYVFRKLPGSQFGAVSEVSKAGGAPTPFADTIGFNVLPAMQVRGDWLFFLNLLDDAVGQIEVMPLGSGPRTVLSQHQWGFPQIAVDSCAVYFSTTAGVERVAHGR